MTAEAFTSRMCFVSLQNRKAKVSSHRLIELTSFSRSIRRFENLAFRKPWKHPPVVGMEDPDVIKITEARNTWTWFFVRSGIQDDTFLRGGQRNDENCISRWDNMWKMGQHSTDGMTQEEILKMTCKPELRMKRKILPPQSRGWRGLDLDFFLLTRHVSLHSAFDDFVFGGHPEVSLPNTPKSRYCGDEHRRNFLQDLWWRTSSLSSSDVEGFRTHPGIWLFSECLIYFVVFMVWRVCRASCCLVGCFATTAFFDDSDHVDRDDSRRESKAVCGTWKLSFCSPDLPHGWLDFAKKQRICAKCAPSMPHLVELFCAWKSKMWRSNTCPTPSKRSSLRISCKRLACEPALTHSVLLTESGSLFINIIQAREPWNRHSDFIPWSCDKHSFMGLLWQCLRFSRQSWWWS